MTWLAALWLGLALAEPTPGPDVPADAELLEFLGSFETNTGEWPELDEALVQKPTRPPTKKEEAKR